MKEAPSINVLQGTLKANSQPKSPLKNNTHIRGDKVVVNGAKQSLLTLLRKYMCLCTKHNLQKSTLKFLTSNKITASYDILVWMFIFLKINCQDKLYFRIVQEYILKMQKKMNDHESHQSQKYIQSKKQTIQKFIKSAELLSCEVLNQKSIEESISTLYSKGKSKENAFKKIQNYLKKINYQECLYFKQKACSFKQKIQTQEIDNQKSQTYFTQASENSEAKIQSNIVLLDQNTIEETIYLLEDYANNSSRKNPIIESYDLFDELIQNYESANSLHNSYDFNFEQTN